MQINRLFEIVHMLLDRDKIAARELAEQFEVSTRTIYRDVEILSAAGIPIFMSKGKGGGISLLPGFVLNKTVLTQREKNDILSGLKAVEAVQFNETDSALKKLGALFGGQQTDWIEVDFSSWYNQEQEATNFQTIKAAILSQTRIRFVYASGKGERTVREVEPLKLCFKGVSRYLYGYCTLREDFRFFKLNRMREIEVTETGFERKVVGPLFMEENLFQETLVDLTLRLSAQMAFRVYDEFEHCTRQEDGSFIVQTKYPIGEWLFPYIASFGSHCEILEPLSLRQAFKEELQKTMHHYF
ncbi:MAG: helix-turn-helix transcriptional regulator [Cellulosilyticaceae bacterium]